MRLQIALPPNVGDQIQELAEAEHRPLKYQVEMLVIEAMNARRGEVPPSPTPERSAEEVAHV